MLVFVVLSNLCALAEDQLVLDGKQPNDRRLQPLKDLNGHFPFLVPDSLDTWHQRAGQLRHRIRVATGIWPMPARTPLNPVIHGRTHRKGFTVEKVYFESLPGHYVTGLLFRPDDSLVDAKYPAVLCPHGHGGRLQRHPDDKLRQMIADGAERFEASGQYPKIARCAQLARMGCVTFIYDMLGYADSQQIDRQLAHRFAKQRDEFEGTTDWGLFSAQAEMRLQSVIGIQTWNSIRCLDFLEQLPDVDSSRMAVTGGSGGGTQTILLCAIDERPVAAFPNGMVSTAMQGGCTCENGSLLRVGTGNVELAALFAPKPQGMTAADDWTVDMMTDGYPELQQLYAMFGVKDHVMCRRLTHFPHNYNYVSRATMYAWFNRHLQLGLEHPPLEEDFEPLSDEELSVWNDQHPQPSGGSAYERQLCQFLATTSDDQINDLTPVDLESQTAYRNVVGVALQTLIDRNLPDPTAIERTNIKKLPRDSYLYFEDILRLSSYGEELPVISLYPTRVDWNGDVVLWIDGNGKQSLFNEDGSLQPSLHELLDEGASVLAADLYQQGEFLSPNDNPHQQRVVSNPREAAAYTYCYNHTLFVQRVHDVLTLIAFVRHDEHNAKRLLMIGKNGAGPIAATARAIAGNVVARAVIDTDGFRFENIRSYRDPNFLPGIVKYGDLPAILALNAPSPLKVNGETSLPSIVQANYQALDATKAVSTDTPKSTTAWLLAR